MILVSSLLIVGCSTHIHTVGYGPQSGIAKTERQYYLLWGLIPINTVNTQADLDKDEINYEIRTQSGVTDYFVMIAPPIFFGVIFGAPFPVGLITSRTVTVTK